jgi:hypothetical protein
MFKAKREEVTGEWRNLPIVRLFTAELGYIVIEGTE